MRIESEITQKVISHVHCWAKYHSNARLLSCKCEKKKERKKNKLGSVTGQTPSSLRRRCRAGRGEWKFFFAIVAPLGPRTTKADDNSGPRRRARSLSLPRGEPIDLQFILTSGKSMRGDMKSPPAPRFFCFFLFTTRAQRFPEMLCNGR